MRHRGVQPRLDGAQRDLQRRADLVIRQLLKVAQQKDLTKMHRHAIDCPADALLDLGAFEPGMRRLGLGRMERSNSRAFRVAAAQGRVQRSSLTPGVVTVMIPRRVGGNAEQPRAQAAG